MNSNGLSRAEMKFIRLNVLPANDMTVVAGITD